MASHSYCPMASHSYCPNGNSKYANDNIYQLTSWPSQYLAPTMGSCHTYQGYPTMRPNVLVGNSASSGVLPSSWYLRVVPFNGCLGSW